MRMTKTKEHYLWVAEDNSGNIYKEGESEFKKVLSLNKEGKIKYFMLEPQLEQFKRMVVKLGGKRRLIFFRKRIFHKGKKLFEWTLHSVGWQETIKGINVKFIAYVYPNGSIEYNNDKPTLMRDYHSQLIEKVYKS